MTASSPLDGLLVIDMAQFLSGPSAALRLGDLGARVIKVERPGTGDICRTLYLSDTDVDGASTLFHAINRGKQSIALDYKVDADRAALLRSEEHTSELQSLMRISYAVFCLKKTKQTTAQNQTKPTQRE